MLRNNTWQQIVMEKLMQQEYDEIGLNVGGDELYDILLGENMTPAVRQLFADPETGMVDREQARMTIRQLIEAPANTPQKLYWLNMENEIASNRKLSKYSNLVAKSLYITDEQAEETAGEEANKADISYIVKSYSTIDDSSIAVSNSEIGEYYNNHLKRFEQEESRKIAYVNFDIEPSGEDFTETEKAVKELADEFSEAEDPIEFVNLSSDKKADRTYYKKAEIKNDSLAAFLFGNRTKVFGPYLEDNAYKISRAGEIRMLPDSVRARHILIAPKGNDYMRAKAVADSLAGLLKKGADFEQLAKANSADQNSAVNGGDLGWFNQRAMVQPLSDSVFFAEIGRAHV